jgi:DNA-binding response OmpR family regulator
MARSSILIVEDNEGTRRLLVRAFRRMGWDALAVPTVAEAMRCFDPAPDALILDLNLPDGVGETILEKIQANRIPTKVIAVTTALTDPLRIRDVASFQPSLIIMKPFDWDVLVRYCTSELEPAGSGSHRA